MNEQTQPQELEGLSARIAKLSRMIGAEHYPTGDRAALKRYSPGATIPLAFYRLWLKHLEEELPNNIVVWATFAFGLATMGKEAHQPNKPLGQVLAEAGYSEARLEQILASDGDIRIKLFTSMVRFLAAKGEGFNWTDAARLLLANDEDKREAIHRRIASDFYRTLSKPKEK